jgi:hypothetical protein
MNNSSTKADHSTGERNKGEAQYIKGFNHLKQKGKQGERVLEVKVGGESAYT